MSRIGLRKSLPTFRDLSRRNMLGLELWNNCTCSLLRCLSNSWMERPPSPSWSSRSLISSAKFLFSLLTVSNCSTVSSHAARRRNSSELWQRRRQSHNFCPHMFAHANSSILLLVGRRGRSNSLFPASLSTEATPIKCAGRESPDVPAGTFSRIYR